MAFRQTTGFVESLLKRIGLDRAVPDVSTLSRRQKTLAVTIPYRGSRGPVHLRIDSTGLEVEAEGAWTARKHGGPKRRVWRKIHLGIDGKTLQIRAVAFTISRKYLGRALWRNWSGDHLRSRVETKRHSCQAAGATPHGAGLRRAGLRPPGR